MKRIALVLLALIMSADVLAQEVMPLPDGTEVFAGNARGYWFQAPEDFTITGIRVPNDFSSLPQSIELMRFNSGAPPLFSGTTNDFTSLFRVANNTSVGVIPVSIQVAAGDFIGVLGVRNDVNSYAPGPFESQIGVNTVPLTRLGMQYTLSANVAADIWQEAAGNISRVEITYVLGSIYSLGGSVTGLTGDLVLQNNAADDLTVSGDGPFQFEALFDSGDSYDVTILSHPVDQICDITNPVGTIGSENVSNIDINCVNTYMVAGMVTGLIPDNSLELQNSAVDDLLITADGPFVFATVLLNNDGYDVTILNQPVDPIQTCEVIDGNGAIPDADVDNVMVNCEFGDDLIYRHGFDTIDAISRVYWQPKE